MSQAAYTYVITPMARLYGSINPAKEEIYLEQLRSFTAEQLGSAWQTVLETYTGQRHPPVAVILDACKKSATTAGYEPLSEQHPWEARDFKRRIAVDKYMEGVRQGNRYLAAKRDGWGRALEQHIRDLAEIQAQIIHPSPSGQISYTTECHNILNHGAAEGNPRDAIQQYIRFWKSQSPTAISVSIPEHSLLILSRMKDAGSAPRSLLQ